MNLHHAGREQADTGGNRHLQAAQRGSYLDRLALILVKRTCNLAGLDVTAEFSGSRQIDEGLYRSRKEVLSNEIVDRSVTSKLDDPRRDPEEYQLLRHDIAVALGKLTAPERMAVEGIYKEEMDTNELSKKMGLSQRRVQMILKKAKEKLAKLLSTEKRPVRLPAKPLPPLPPSLGFCLQRDMMLTPRGVGRDVRPRRRYKIDDVLKYYYHPESGPPQEISPDISPDIVAKKTIRKEKPEKPT